MKKWLVLCLVVLCLLFTAALADINLPYDIQSILDSKYSGPAVTGYVNPGYGRTAFAAIQTNGRRYLVCFESNGGGWSFAWARKETLPQDGDDIVLIDRSNTNYGGIRLGRAFSAREYENGCYETLWEQSNGTWYLRAMFYIGPDGDIIDSFKVYSDGVQYNGWDGNQFVSGSVQSNIRYFVYSVFPKNLSTLRNKLSTPPYIPDGMLQAENIHFTGGRQYEVYSGPGDEYLRGGNGKAMVSTNDWIQVFGSENGWILIQYNITRGRMRFGWIPEYALPDGAYVEELNFSPVVSYTLNWVDVTDDPLNSQSVLTSLPGGEPVYWLATMGDWVYIEYDGEDLFRGFVPLNAISSSDSFDMSMQPMDDGTPVFNGFFSVDGYRAKAELMPITSGPLGGVSLRAVRVYDTDTNQELGQLYRDASGKYSGTFNMDGLATSLTFVGEDNAGTLMWQYAVRVEW